MQGYKGFGAVGGGRGDGEVAAVLIGRDWLSQFTDQVSLSPWSMALCLLVILTVILAVVCLNALKVARSNPVDYLRTA